MVHRIHIKRVLPLLLPLIIVLVSVGISLLSRNVQEFADWYNQWIYPIFMNVIGRISNLIPFSLVELTLYGLILLIVSSIIYAIYKIVKKQRKVTEVLLGGVKKTSWLVAVLYLMFVLLCGINYHRTSFATLYEFQDRAYTVEELEQISELFVKRINEINESRALGRLEDGTYTITRQDIVEAKLTLRNIGQTYPVLQGYYPNPKPLLFSEILSYQQVSGIYVPFTVEANYNADMESYAIPFTVIHELAHVKGFMKEEEANFISFLACTNSSNIKYEYSGYMYGYSYVIKELRKMDQNAYQRIIKLLGDEANEDYRRGIKFWNQYKGAVATISTKVNDTYLKANAQPAGVKSYNHVVGLITASYKKNSIIH